jgi:hypothetical protein
MAKGGRKIQLPRKGEGVPKTSQKPKMKWLPVSAIPHIASQMEGLLAADERNYEALLKAKLRPGLLDSETLDRLIQAFTAQGRELAPCEEQLVRWKNAVMSDAHRDDLNRIGERLERIRGVVTSILALASEVKASASGRPQGSRSSSPITAFPPFRAFK